MGPLTVFHLKPARRDAALPAARSSGSLRTRTEMSVVSCALGSTSSLGPGRSASGPQASGALNSAQLSGIQGFAGGTAASWTGNLPALRAVRPTHSLRERRKGTHISVRVLRLDSALSHRPALLWQWHQASDLVPRLDRFGGCGRNRLPRTREEGATP